MPPRTIATWIASQIQPFSPNWINNNWSADEELREVAEAANVNRFKEAKSMTLSRARKAWWRGQREQASTPAYTLQEAEGHWFVVLREVRVAGPMSNAEAWRWNRQTKARRYGQGESAA